MCVFLFAVISSLGGENGSELSPSHSNTLRNSSSVVIDVRTASTAKKSTTTALPKTTTPTIQPSTTVPTLPSQHRWSVTDDGNVCLLLESGIRMKFNYVKHVRVLWCCSLSGVLNLFHIVSSFYRVQRPSFPLPNM